MTSGPTYVITVFGGTLGRNRDHSVWLVLRIRYSESLVAGIFARITVGIPPPPDR